MKTKGGSPGLVVMGDNSCLKGHGFKSWCHILDGHFFTLIYYKNCIVCFKKTKNKQKKVGLALLKKINFKNENSFFSLHPNHYCRGIHKTKKNKMKYKISRLMCCSAARTCALNPRLKTFRGAAVGRPLKP